MTPDKLPVPYWMKKWPPGALYVLDREGENLGCVPGRQGHCSCPGHQPSAFTAGCGGSSSNFQRSGVLEEVGCAPSLVSDYSPL